jgi:hypothetical protein
MKTVPPSPSQSYLIAAKGLFLGAEALASNSGQTGMACAFLAAQVLECALKSYLAHAGKPESELKESSLRHNLELLWTQAVGEGLNVQSEPPDWCCTLNSAHDKPYYFRYPMELNVSVFPDLLPMVSDLKSLLAAVEKVIS